MVAILGLSGSLRKGSYNSMLLRAAAQTLPEGVTLTIESIADVPLYNYDVEVEAFPESALRLKKRLQDADGLLLVTPEYNNSVPGTLKNAIDWMSRPSKELDDVFSHKPVALMGASNGLGGTRLSQTAWLPVFRTLGMVPYHGSILYMDRAQLAFDEKGTVLDDKMKERIRRFVSDFASFIEKQKR
jgi:NAD(P)H-dependent FMN reductase